MTDNEFLNLASNVLEKIEVWFEKISDSFDFDIDFNRSGNVLEIEFLSDNSKIIVNTQSSLQEIWVASRSGGFHFKLIENSWINTQNQEELFMSLAKLVNENFKISIEKLIFLFDE